MTNPYDIPPAEPTGSATADEVFLSVGMALTQWEMLEQELADLFGSLCDTSSMAPSLAYGAVVASSSRGDMLKAAAASFYYLREVELAEVIKAVDFARVVSDPEGNAPHNAEAGGRAPLGAEIQVYRRTDPGVRFCVRRSLSADQNDFLQSRRGAHQARAIIALNTSTARNSAVPTNPSGS